MPIKYLTPENVSYIWIDVLNPTEEELQEINNKYTLSKQVFGKNNID